MALSPTVLIQGLVVDTEIYLGPHPPASGCADVTVRIRPARALSLRPIRPGRFETRGRDVFIGVPGGGVLMVRRGREIWVDPGPGMQASSMASAVLAEGFDVLMSHRRFHPVWRADDHAKPIARPAPA